MSTIDPSLKAGADIALGEGMAGKTKGLTGKGAPKDAGKAAQDFEAMFISQMMSHMFQSVTTDPLFGGGHGEEMFKSMMVDEYGKMTAKRGGFGIAEAMKREFLKMQEVK